MNFYSQGVDQTLTTLIVVASILVAIGIAACFQSASQISRLKLWMLAGINISITPAAVALSLFPVVYSSINLGYQNVLSASFWKEELSTGVFAIRISSYLLTFHFLLAITRLIRHKRELAKVRSARGLDVDDVANYTIDRRPNETKLWLSGDLALIATFQFCFYLSAVTALWFCAIQGIHSLPTALASWCLFFIVDDWVVISDYTSQFDVPAISSHTMKVMGFNIALLVLIPIALFSTSEKLVALPLALVLLLSAFGVAMYTWRSKKFGAEV